MQNEADSPAGAPERDRPRPPAGRRPPEPVEEISLLELVNVLLRHRWKVVGLPVALAVLVVAFTLLGAATYTTRASFMPQVGSGSGGQLSRLSGVAAQFGVNVPTGEAGQSPQFYADLVTSPRILRNTVAADYTVASGEDTLSGDLVEMFGIEAETRAAAIEKAVQALEERLSVSTGPETGVVELSVTTGSPALSRQIGDRLVELVNQFNLEVRQSQAAAQAEFVANRLDTARRELRAAEDSLERFLERNRSFRNSPTLQFEHQRLQRRVDRKQQVVTSLATRYEEAQINRVRNTPVITVVTPPTAPARPDARRLPLKGVLGLLLGGMLGVFWAFGAEFNRSAREEDRDAYEEFLNLREDARRDLHHFRQKLSDLLGRSTG